MDLAEFRIRSTRQGAKALSNQRSKTSYANRHPGLYTLERIETISTYFTEKE